MIKAVIFDMDGVLIDTEKYYQKCWRTAAAEFGYPMTEEQSLQLRSLAAKYARVLLKDMFGAKCDYDNIRARRKELMNETLAAEGIQLKPGVMELLDFLKEHHIKTAVATATDEKRTEKYLKQMGLFTKFDEIVCATMVENGKPKPDIYLYACGQIGERPEECIGVEDSPNGVRAALDAGLCTIMVPDLTQPETEIKKELYAVADTLFDIIPLIKQEIR